MHTERYHDCLSLYVIRVFKLSRVPNYHLGL